MQILLLGINNYPELTGIGKYTGACIIYAFLRSIYEYLMVLKTK